MKTKVIPQENLLKINIHKLCSSLIELRRIKYLKLFNQIELANSGNLERLDSVHNDDEISINSSVIPKRNKTKQKEIKLFICHYKSDFVNNLISTMNTLKNDLKVFVECNKISTELELLFTLQKDFDLKIEYDAVLIGDNFKTLDLFTIIAILHEMIQKKNLNDTLRIIPFIGGTEEDEILSENNDNTNKRIR